MNREEKEQYIIRLYKEGRSTREIAEVVHMSFRDIGTIIKKVKSEDHGERSPSEEDEDIKSKSKTTQAFKLFSNNPLIVDTTDDWVAISIYNLSNLTTHLSSVVILKGLYPFFEYCSS